MLTTSTLYTTTLFIHAYIRWLVVIFAVLALGRAISGLIRRRTWTGSDRLAGSLFAVSMDIQLLLGLALYMFLSPLTTAAFSNVGDAMRDSELRYWLVEHIALMVLAVVLAHLGTILARRARTDVGKHRRAAITFGLATLAVLAAIPWPVFSYGRPLFRLG